VEHWVGAVDEDVAGDGATAGPPDGRDNHTAIWTGTEMIIWGGFVMFSVGGAVGYFAFDIHWRTWASLQLVSAGDLITGLTKCIAYSAAMAPTR